MSVDAQGLALVITAVSGLIIAMGTCTATILAAMRTTNRKVDAVMGEVKTINSLSLAQLADAVEKRRILEEPAGDRTADDREHLRAMKEEGK